VLRSGASKTTRAAKRMRNLYRLVRISIPEAELGTFIGDCTGGRMRSCKSCSRSSPDIPPRLTTFSPRYSALRPSRSTWSGPRAAAARPDRGTRDDDGPPTQPLPVLVPGGLDDVLGPGPGQQGGP
jgi:hypothetical protein